jgi:hypothetical protein
VNYKGLEGSAAAVPGEELDIIANPPPALESNPPKKQQPLHEVPAAVNERYPYITERLSGSQRFIAFGFVVGICLVIYKSRQASRARATLQEKTMA